MTLRTSVACWSLFAIACGSSVPEGSEPAPDASSNEPGDTTDASPGDAAAPPLGHDAEAHDAGTTPTCITSAMPLDASGTVVNAFFASPTRVVYSTTETLGGAAKHRLFERELCGGIESKLLLELDRPDFALDESGVPLVYVAGEGNYRLARLRGGELEAVPSSCTFSGFESLDVAGSTAIVTHGPSVQVERIELEELGCVESTLNEQSTQFPLGAGASEATARIDVVSNRVLMAGVPLNVTQECRSADEGLDYDDNDFLLYDLSSDQRSMADFTPPVPRPECDEVRAMAWFSDGRRVLAASSVFSTIDLETGETALRSLDTRNVGDVRRLDIAPDDRLLVVVAQLGAYVTPL